MNKHRSIPFITVFALVLALFNAPEAFAQKIKINKATPAWAEQGTGTPGDPLEVQIDGEGLIDVTGVRFLVSGTRNNQGGITVTDFIEDNPERVRAYIVVDDAAVLDYFDIEMTTLRGRRGKGNTLFKVVEKGGSPYSGERIDLNCALLATSGDGRTDTVKADGEPGVHTAVYGAYVDAEEKANCRTGGTVQPNFSGLSLDPKLRGGPPKRKIDLVLTNFLGPDESTVPPSNLPGHIFEEGPFWDDMEVAYLTARPYRQARPANHYRGAAPAQNHIQLLTPDYIYSMATRIRLKSVADHRYVINLADAEPDIPDDQFTGLYCHSATPSYLNEDIVKVSQDVNVYLWPDADRDGVADGYTVTTGTVSDDHDSYSLANPPNVISAPRTAAICSQTGPIECDGAGLGEFCNFLGFVDVQFTWHAENMP